MQLFENKMNLTLSSFLLVIMCCFKLSNAQVCSFNYKTDFPDPEPIMLLGNLMVMAENNDITPNSDIPITLACPGNRNTIRILGTSSAQATCVSGQTLKIGTTNYLLKDLACSKKVVGDVKTTTDRCGNRRGNMIKIGYEINTQFHSLLNSCYDDNKGEAIYAEHVIHGSAIGHAKLKKHKEFKVGGLASDVKARKAYEDQKATLLNLLGSQTLVDKYINTNSMFVKGHLSPDGDHIFVESSSSTYFYINTVPQWRQINNANWKKLENAIRKTASNLREDIRVITGGFEILQLQNANGILVDITLSNGKLAVPKFVWKIIYSLETEKAIAFVNFNNPFVNPANVPQLCTNICQTSGWGNIEWYDPTKGFIYCCEVDELRRRISIIPSYFSVSGVQNFVAN